MRETFDSTSASVTLHECPSCGALNLSDGLMEGEHVTCHGCGEVLEYDGHGFWVID